MLQLGWITGDEICHLLIVSLWRRLDLCPMDLPPLRYLSASDVVASMPDIDTRLELAATTMVALAGE